MAARYILGVLSVVFLVLGSRAWLSGTVQGRAQGRTWLIVGGIFAVVSVWLFVSAGSA